MADLPDDPSQWIIGMTYNVPEDPFAKQLADAADVCLAEVKKYEALAAAFSGASMVANGAPLDDVLGSTPRERAINYLRKLGVDPNILEAVGLG
jgi:hypothetical protein